MTTPLALAPLRRYLRHGTLPQLAAFEAVVRLGSATRAADALCIAQPTISGHLRKLGESLGVRLFEMRGKRLVPTAAALALLQATHEVSAAFERCEHTLGTYRQDEVDSVSGR
jgi:DNA-binding transcriptional LysR family regulator